MSGTGDHDDEGEDRISVLAPEDLPANHTLVPWATDAGIYGTAGGATTEPIADTPSGSRFSILQLVGEGAMGEVHLARDEDLLRNVAYKKLRTEAHVAPAARRFLSEVQISAQLDHPYIVPVYGLSIAPDGSPAYTMKLVKGRTLEQVFETAKEQAKKGVPDTDHCLAARLELFLKVCDAIEYAHSKGVIHRDIKPANIMVGRHHEVYVMDWGLARIYGETTSETEPTVPADVPIDETGEIVIDSNAMATQYGAVLGTPAYMSPEQAQGRGTSLGPASDQYALGLLLYEAISLRMAYDGKSAREVLNLAATADKAPMRVDEMAEPVSQELRAIVAKATANRPTDRYGSVDEMADDLRSHLRGQETVALPDNVGRRVRRLAVRHIRATLLAFVAVLVLAVGMVGWRTWQHQVQVAEQKISSQQRQQDLSDYIGLVQRAAGRVDNRFLWYESLLEGMATAATHAITRGVPEDVPTYDRTQFADPARMPPDTFSSPYYPHPISLDHPVYHAPPGSDAEVWRDQLARLYALRPIMRSVVLSRPTGETADLRVEDMPIDWVYVALADTGLMTLFPGSTPRWAPDYDPRKRPWYQETVQVKQRIWGTPYVDLMGQGNVITCGKAIYDGDRLLGVAALDLRLDFVIEQYLTDISVPGERKPAVHAAYLLDRQGRVVVHTVEGVFEARQQADGTLEMPPFHNKAVMQRFDGRSGFLEEGDHLFAWAPLRHLGWTYVVQTEIDRLFE